MEAVFAFCFKGTLFIPDRFPCPFCSAIYLLSLSGFLILPKIENLDSLNMGVAYQEVYSPFLIVSFPYF
jgi:hypothetical protein